MGITYLLSMIVKKLKMSVKKELNKNIYGISDMAIETDAG